MDVREYLEDDTGKHKRLCDWVLLFVSENATFYACKQQ